MGADRDHLQERIELSLLYDFYGALLKDSARQMFEAYILEDYGYSEIAEQEGISRQGAYDAIRRSSRQLREYEDKLGLVKRFQEQQNLLEQIHSELVELDIPRGRNQNLAELIARLEKIV